MKIGEAIQRVQSLYSKGVQSDDSRLAIRHIYNKLLTVRAMIFIEQLDKGKKFSEWTIQPLHKIEMANHHNINSGNSVRCSIMKSKSPLPRGLSNDHTENVTVVSYDGLVKFNRTTFESVKRIRGNKYGSELDMYYIHDDYLYLVNNEMKYAYMHGLWFDPILVYRMHMANQGYSTLDIINTEIDFYTPEQYMERIIKITTEELVMEFSQMKEDKTNDGNDN